MKNAFYSLKLLTLFLLSALSLQNCTAGCLLCSSSGQCHFCDFQHHYYLRGFTCSPKKIRHCQFMSIAGDCILCKPNFVLDKITGNCIIVPPIHHIQACHHYYDLMTCLGCSGDYYLHDGGCHAVAAPIDNCKTYGFENGVVCADCGKGYVSAADWLSCVEIRYVGNCALYHSMECRRCAAGYVLDKNYYLSFLFDTGTDLKRALLYEYMTHIRNGDTDGYAFRQCIQATVANCAEYYTFNKCRVCEDGFYLDYLYQCKQSPFNSVRNCKKYSDVETCVDCENTFRLVDSRTCSPVEPIEHCTNYQGEVATSSCELCARGYMLANEKCVIRSDSFYIDNCSTYTSDEDTCQSCKTSYSLSTDKLKCLPVIDNCYQYEPSSIIDERLLCNMCNSGYFVDTFNFTCVKGSVTNCFEYVNVEDSCRYCDNKFFPEGPTNCIEHVNIQNCKTTSQNTLHKCSTCEDYTLSFDVVNKCVEFPYVQFCRTPISSEVCYQCEEGHMADAEDQCGPQPEDFQGCRKINEHDDCIACSSDEQMLWPVNQKCVDPLPHSVAYCGKNFKQGESFICDFCKENAYVISKDSLAVCVPDDNTYINPVEHCERYSFQNETVTCKQCAETFILQEGVCVESCEHTIVIQSLTFHDGYTTLGATNTCVDISMPFCAAAVQRTDQVESFACVRCKDSISHYVYPLTTGENQDPVFSQYFSTKHNYSDYFSIVRFDRRMELPSVTCFDLDGAIFLPANDTNQISNCELYRFDVSFFGCIRCLNGFSGPSNDGYLTHCDNPVDFWESDAYDYGNVNPHSLNLTSDSTPLTVFLSATKCFEGRPHIFVKRTDIGTYKLVPYDLTNDPPHTNASVVADDAVRCLRSTHIDYSLSHNSVVDSIPDKCAIIYVKVDMVKSANRNDNPSFLCAACEPNTKPVYDNEDIIDCVDIEQCNVHSNELRVFNTCGECEILHTFGIDPTTLEIDYTTCVYQPISFCDLTNINNNKCVSCRKGYFLNADDYCDIIKMNDCQSDSFNDSSHGYIQNSPNLRYNLYKALNGHGCTDCSELTMDIDDEVCVISMYLDMITLPDSTSYVAHCVNYYLKDDETVGCSQCMEEYISNEEEKKCHHYSETLEGCEIAVDDSACATCEHNMVLEGTVCRTPTIDYCESYQQGATTQTCQQCIGGFMLQDNICTEGEVRHCKRFSALTTCTECETGFVLLYMLDGLTYCFPIPPNLHCNIDHDAFRNGDIECDTCYHHHEFAPDDHDIEKNLCAHHLDIQNCQEYDFNTTFADSTLDCTECSNGYFLNEGVCVKRLNFTNSCYRYAATEDICEQCLIGYFPSADQTSCTKYPKGISNCEVYSSSSKCSHCVANAYKLDDKCVDVPLEDRLHNCKRYKNPSTCYECDQGYLLEFGHCIQLNAKNCLTAIDVNTCEFCPDRYILESEGDLVNCIPFTDDNCEDYDLYAPATCLACIPNFYFDKEAGVCVEVPEKMINCLYYETAKKCSGCNRDSVLAIDGSKCHTDIKHLRHKEHKCVDVIVKPGASCMTCQVGHYFNTYGDCVRCPKNTSADGCFSCNPLNPAKCALCHIGYYMNRSGLCISLNKSEKASDSVTTDKRGWIAGLKIVLVLFVLGV